jgi:nucleotide-binding universal stress UspA family protein
MTVLVPTDFSENANQAIEYAVEICRATGSRLILLHVGPESQRAVRQQLQLQEKLSVLSKAITDEYQDLVCETEIAVGDIVEEILQQAENSNAGLIVMGTQGASNLGKLFFGSNTASVIEKASCIVLSVPANCYFRKPEKMLFSTNFTREDLKAAIDFVNLARSFEATVIIAHVSTEHEREELETSMVEIFTNEVAHLTGYKKILSKVVSENTIGMGMDALIAETGADMIALSTRRRGVFEKLYNPSLTKKLSLQANIPLFAFHSETVHA